MLFALDAVTSGAAIPYSWQVSRIRTGRLTEKALKESIMKTRVLILAVCISLIVVAALAHNGEEHVIGTVANVTHDSITVNTTENKVVTVGVVSQTGSECRSPLCRPLASPVLGIHSRDRQ